MANNYFAGYYNKMIQWPYDVPDSSNSWMNFFNPQTACCSLMVQNGGWPSGYTQQNRMCLDTWGDGQLQNFGTSNYQIYGCDDGNNKDEDWWDEHWYEEKGWAWKLIPGSLKSYCYKSCGDGIYDSSKGEECDDGNELNSDGCSDSWKIESGYSWLHDTTPDKWVPDWGDGLIQSGEDWDDKNNMDLDGWSSTWKAEEGYTWTYNSIIKISFWVSSMHYSPIVTIDSFDTINFVVILNFNDTMRQVEITSDAISLLMKGDKEPYSITWSASFISSSKLSIYF